MKNITIIFNTIDKIPEKWEFLFFKLTDERIEIALTKLKWHSIQVFVSISNSDINKGTTVRARPRSPIFNNFISIYNEEDP